MHGTHNFKNVYRLTIFNLLLSSEYSVVNSLHWVRSIEQRNSLEHIPIRDSNMLLDRREIQLQLLDPKPV